MSRTSKVVPSFEACAFAKFQWNRRNVHQERTIPEKILVILFNAAKGALLTLAI